MGLIRNIVAGLAGGAGFLLFLFPLEAGFLASAGVGVATYAGVLLSTLRRKPLTLKLGALEGLDESSVTKTILEGHDIVETIALSGKKIRDRDIRLSIETVCASARKILRDFEEDPKDIRLGKRNFMYYMDATRRIVERCYDLDKHDIKTTEMEALMNRIRVSLKQVDDALGRLLVKLLQNDIMDLNTEMSVLEKTIKIEDF